MVASGSIFSSQYLILLLVCLPDSYFIHSKDMQCFSQLQVVALILARGGSKGVPRKNLIKINGVSLIGRAVKAAYESQVFSEIWVSTDDDEIADEGRQYGARIHRRPLEFAYDNSSSIDAVQEFLSVHHEVNFIGLIQCTSVFINAKFLQAAYEKILTADCVFSVTPNFKLRWSFDGNGQYLKPLNFNPRNRPRRQDWIGELIETGMFYFAKKQLILQEHILQNERCKAVIIPPEESLEIDTLYELKIAKCLTES